MMWFPWASQTIFLSAGRVLGNGERWGVAAMLQTDLHIRAVSLQLLRFDISSSFFDAHGFFFGSTADSSLVKRNFCTNWTVSLGTTEFPLMSSFLLFVFLSFVYQFWVYHSWSSLVVFLFSWQQAFLPFHILSYSCACNILYVWIGGCIFVM